MRTPANPVHPTAAEGYAVGADAYVRGRPDYPAGVAQWLREALGLGPGKRVVDLGAGTGKFIPRLLATGATVIAVEPVAAMLGKLSDEFPHVEAHLGSATAMLLPNASVDAVVCAQAFHWFATRDALDEIHRILVPGGRLGMIWNQRDASVDWIARLNAIVNRYEADAPRYYTGAWRRAFPHRGFGPLHETHFPHAHAGSIEDVLFNRVRSTSFIAALPADARARIDSEIAVLVAMTPALAGKKEVSLPYDTAAFVATKAPDR